MKTERTLTFGQTTLIAEGTLIKGEPGTEVTPEIPDVFEAEEYHLEFESPTLPSSVELTELISDLNDLLTQHPKKCECGKKHIFDLHKLFDELNAKKG